MKSLLGLSAITSGYAGHAHFGERALSRRRFLTTAAAGTLGLVLGSGLRLPAPAYADDDLPGQSGSVVLHEGSIARRTYSSSSCTRRCRGRDRAAEGVQPTKT